MKLKLRIIIALVFFLFIPSILRAELIVEFGSGKTFKGEISGESEKSYIFNVSGQEMELKKSLIKSIVRERDKKVIYDNSVAHDDGKIIFSEKDEKDGRVEEKTRFGSISGVISLPILNNDGYLYVWFSPVITKSSDKYYQRIEAKDIVQNKAIYKIDNIPAGEYKGFATWDTAEPKWKKSWGEGNYPSYAGDYAGSTGENIIVSEGEEVEKVNLDCTFYLKPMKKNSE